MGLGEQLPFLALRFAAGTWTQVRLVPKFALFTLTFFCLVLDVHGVIHGATELASSGHLLEMQNPWPPSPDLLNQYLIFQDVLGIQGEAGDTGLWTLWLARIQISASQTSLCTHITWDLVQMQILIQWILHFDLTPRRCLSGWPTDPTLSTKGLESSRYIIKYNWWLYQVSQVCLKWQKFILLRF